MKLSILNTQNCIESLVSNSMEHHGFHWFRAWNYSHCGYFEINWIFGPPLLLAILRCLIDIGLDRGGYISLPLRDHSQILIILCCYFKNSPLENSRWKWFNLKISRKILMSKMLQFTMDFWEIKWCHWEITVWTDVFGRSYDFFFSKHDYWKCMKSLTSLNEWH